LTTLFIEAGDVWLFRDGRPFSAGSDHRAQSQFPPLPTTIAGMVRTSYLLANGIDFDDFKNKGNAAAKAAIGSPDEGDYGAMQLRGPFLTTQLITRRDGKPTATYTRYYPAPADLYVADREYWLPQVQKVGGGLAVSALATSHLLYTSNKEAKNAAGWLDAEAMKAYLAAASEQPVGIAHTLRDEDDLKDWLAQGAPASVVVAGDLLSDDEERLGIKLQAGGKSTEEGMLYTVSFTRPQWRGDWRVGLGLELDELGWPPLEREQGAVSLGGERRVGLYRKIGDAQRPAPVSGPRIKVYFTTPTCFNKGWLPGNCGDFFAGEPQVAATALGRPLTVAGFDLANHRHKPAHRYVPAGSVYYLEGKGGSTITYNGKPITDQGGAIGFGQVLIGGW